MSGSQVFYMGENGEVILWDGTTKVDPAAYSVTADDPKTGIDYDIGYAQALRDVLVEIAASGKQNLVQWLEARLKDLP